MTISTYTSTGIVKNGPPIPGSGYAFVETVLLGEETDVIVPRAANIAAMIGRDDIGRTVEITYRNCPQGYVASSVRLLTAADEIEDIDPVDKHLIDTLDRVERKLNALLNRSESDD